MSDPATATRALDNSTDASYAYDVLDEKQVGSLRHIGNIVRQAKNDWSNMLGPTDLNQDGGGFRYQLPYMTYALTLAHFHRLPAAPGVFRDTIQRLIAKMQLPAVWFDWHDISKGGGFLNQEAPATEGWINPVEKDNIMYSAYLQVMPLLYNVLFDDDRYARPGAITLAHRPKTWGDRNGYIYEYDQNSLNERIYWQMVENGYLGVACEPYCVFQICNQPAILAFRMHDVLNGGNTAEEVTTGYLKAWEQFGGLLDKDGHYNTLVKMYSQTVVPNVESGGDAWLGSLMNAWNGDFVQQHYARQRARWVHKAADGTLRIDPPEAKHGAAEPPASCAFGWFAVWAAEMGDSETLAGLLAHADAHMSPTWSNGGYHYARLERVMDDEGNLTSSHPHQNNALFPYARLNVPNGLRKLYEKPWGAEHFAEPALTEVSFALDILRAVYDRPSDTLIFDARRSEDHKPGDILIARLFGRGDWTLTRNGATVARGNSQALVEAIEEPGVSVRQDGDSLRLTLGHLDIGSYRLSWN